MGDDDFFSDGDLDDIPDSTLSELEKNAYSSTQRPKAAAVRMAVPQQPRKSFHGAISLNRAGSLNKNPQWKPPQLLSRPPPVVPPNATALRGRASTPASSDYGFDDEDVINLDEPSTILAPSGVSQGSNGIPLRPSAAAASLYGRKAVLDPETEAAYAAADAELGASLHGRWGQQAHLQHKSQDNVDVASLLARIEELQAEQARLRLSEQEARNAVMAKHGEIAIVRANQEKAAKEYERRIEVMRKMHADETAKQKAELEAGRKEREKMKTDNRFLQHEVAEEVERAKRMTGAVRPMTSTSDNDKGGTPSKLRRTGVGDGFEDNEVRVISPSRSRDKQKDHTPKHPAKRKRTVNDSPVAPLSFTQPAESIRRENSGQAQSSIDVPSSAVSVINRQFEFLQRMLRHRPYKGHEPAVEALSKYYFPTEKQNSLFAILMNTLTYSSGSDELEHYPLKLSRALLELWSRCLNEQLYSPLYLILDLLRFALYFELPSVISELVEDAVPLCDRSVHLVATPIGRASINAAFAANLDREALNKLVDEVDVDEVMDFLRCLCEAASQVSERLEVFWKHMDLRFTLLMLNKAQPISQITTCLRILETSARENTFGPICNDPDQQTRQETNLVDRLTSLLFDMPEPPMDEPAYSEEEIAEIRVAILKVFRSMCLTKHGGLLLAHHVHAIGRLIRFLNGQVDKAYRILPLIAPTNANTTHKPTPHSLVIQTINMTTRLVYHLIRTYGDVVDISQKLKVIHGGYHKFLVSMTRIAFSEQLVFEHGIEDGVAEAAHAILDNSLTPEEGEAIAMAVETPKGSKGSDPNRGLGMNARIEVDGDATMSDEPGST